MVRRVDGRRAAAACRYLFEGATVASLSEELRLSQSRVYQFLQDVWLATAMWPPSARAFPEEFGVRLRHVTSRPNDSPPQWADTPEGFYRQLLRERERFGTPFEGAFYDE